MTKETLDAKRDELADTFTYRMNVSDRDIYLMGFNACRDILLPLHENQAKTIDELKPENYLALKGRITQLQKENTELTKDLKMCREIGVEMQREVNRKQTIQMNTLTRKLEIATNALGFYADPRTMTGPLMAKKALASINEVENG